MPSSLINDNLDLGFMQAPVFKPQARIPDLSALLGTGAKVKALQEKWDELNEKYKPDLDLYQKTFAQMIDKGTSSDIDDARSKLLIPTMYGVEQMEKKSGNQYYSMVQTPEFKSLWNNGNDWAKLKVQTANQYDDFAKAKDEVETKQVGQEVDLSRVVNPFKEQVDNKNGVLKVPTLNESVKDRQDLYAHWKYPDFESTVVMYDNFKDIKNDAIKIYSSIQGNSYSKDTEPELKTITGIGDVIHQVKTSGSDNSKKIDNMTEQLVNGSILSDAQVNTLKSQFMQQTNLVTKDSNGNLVMNSKDYSDNVTGNKFNDNFNKNFKAWEANYFKGIATSYKDISSTTDIGVTGSGKDAGSSARVPGTNVQTLIAHGQGATVPGTTPMEVPVMGKKKGDSNAVVIPVGTQTHVMMPQINESMRYQMMPVGPVLLSNNVPAFLNTEDANQMFILDGTSNNVYIMPKLKLAPYDVDLPAAYKIPEQRVYIDQGPKTPKTVKQIMNIMKGVVDPDGATDDGADSYGEYRVMVTGSGLKSMQSHGDFLNMMTTDEDQKSSPWYTEDKSQAGTFGASLSVIRSDGSLNPEALGYHIADPMTTKQKTDLLSSLHVTEVGNGMFSNTTYDINTDVDIAHPLTANQLQMREQLVKMLDENPDEKLYTMNIKMSIKAAFNELGITDNKLPGIEGIGSIR